jgi:hypothetical protein
LDNTSHEDLFREYYHGNSGRLYKSFQLEIGNHKYKYDIYWGDPKVIFDSRSIADKYPLAVTAIPHRYPSPNPRVFLHEELEEKYGNAFEFVVTHEIGHLWLHDIIGFNNPSTENLMNESDSEIWADYFAYSFFLKYRQTAGLDAFEKVLKEASDIQLKMYKLDPERHIEFTFIRKLDNLKRHKEGIELQCEKGNQIYIHMKNATEITLNALGDIFEAQC